MEFTKSNAYNMANFQDDLIYFFFIKFLIYFVMMSPFWVTIVCVNTNMIDVSSITRHAVLQNDSMGTRGNLIRLLVLTRLQNKVLPLQHNTNLFSDFRVCLCCSICHKSWNFTNTVSVFSSRGKSQISLSSRSLRYPVTINLSVKVNHIKFNITTFTL